MQSNKIGRKLHTLGMVFFILIFLSILGFSSPQTDKDTAQTLKKTGDQYVDEGDYKNAAVQYLKALELARRDFSHEEKLVMIEFIAWGEKLQEAEAELKIMLDEDPEDLEARAFYARVLSWAGSYDHAIKEAYQVLNVDPDHKEALLVVADVLNWSNNKAKAIPIYLKLLEKEEKFEARLGLAYCLLATGKSKEAKANRKMLKPSYPYQENELEKLDDMFERQGRPELEAHYSYYHDSEENTVQSYYSNFKFWTGKWQFTLSFRHIDAYGSIYDNRAEVLSFSAYSRITDGFGLGMGIGGTQLGNGESTNFVVGHAQAEWNFLAGQMGILARREVYTYTSLLIENQIVVNTAGIYLTQNLSRRFILQSDYYYRDYSDENSSNDFSISGNFVFRVSAPRVILGYSFRIMDFERHTGSGYFDPDDFRSHMVFLVLFHESEKLFLYIRPYFGHQSFNRYGERVEGYFGGGYGTLRFALAKRWWLELHAEGGNYAAATAAGWNYYLVSAGLVYKF